jgi:rare lipoprotein A
MYRLTCAHRDLPLGSWVKVTNLHNHKWVVLRVNDRGPFVDDRVIDLSYAAAQMLSINGVARVKLELLPPDSQSGPAQPTTLAQLAPPAHPGR